MWAAGDASGKGREGVFQVGTTAEAKAWRPEKAWSLGGQGAWHRRARGEERAEGGGKTQAHSEESPSPSSPSS